MPQLGESPMPTPISDILSSQLNDSLRQSQALHPENILLQKELEDFHYQNHVYTHQGTSPIILSIPHGGNKKYTHIPTHQGTHLLDSCTFQLGLSAYRHFKSLGLDPSVVLMDLHRQHVDANRPPGNFAFSSPEGQAAYEEYHSFILSVINRWENQKETRTLLLDIHGNIAAQNDGCIEASVGSRCLCEKKENTCLIEKGEEEWLHAWESSFLKPYLNKKGYQDGSYCLLCDLWSEGGVFHAMEKEGLILAPALQHRECPQEDSLLPYKYNGGFISRQYSFATAPGFKTEGSIDFAMFRDQKKPINCIQLEIHGNPYRLRVAAAIETGQRLAAAFSSAHTFQ